ncbi:MAG: dihydrolipoyl dehydrogenase [Muribaculaceae bacterium]|nr:dihydrolipoyl dehydrogenase [Muribaculaceae bacterium]MDE6130593.1 dihydrolipoyl dehydrogenase [Muribaculaceae bacterium]
MKAFDYIIIGAGPGGYKLASGLAAGGHSVAVIEKDRLGGTCLNRGCIPTKCLCASADALTAARHSAEFGVSCGEVTFDFGAVRRRVDQVVATLGEGVKALLTQVELYHGEARLLGEGRVAVGDEILQAGKIVIATGSRPAVLPVEGAEYALTSDELLAIESLPQSAVIIGGGVIGIEFASILCAMDVDVTVVEYCKEILPGFDADMAKRLRSMLSRRGIKFITGAEVTAIRDGGKEVCYRSRKGEDSVWADMSVMAVGRRPVLPEGLVAAGVELTPRGFIKVDSRMATSAPGIYAVGDVNGLCLLAHAAYAQGRIVAGGESDLNVIPSAVFCKPEAAMVGMGEDSCKNASLPYKTIRKSFAANGKALAMGESDGVAKIVYDSDSGNLLGFQIIGPHAADLIAECAALLHCGATIDQLGSLIHAHPTLSEVLAI